MRNLLGLFRHLKNNLKQYSPNMYYINPDTGEKSSYYSYARNITRVVKEGGLTTNNREIQRCFEHFYQNDSQYFENMCFENSKEFIAESFKIDNPVFHEIICKNPTILKIIGDVINKNIINMINGGDIQGAINSFKCEKTTSNNLIDVVTKSIKDKIAMIENKINNIASNINISQYQKLIETGKELKKKSELTKKIKNIEEKLKENKQCVICYDEPENPCYTKCCNTKYCLECLTEVIKMGNPAKCPYCREPITNDTMLILNDKEKCHHAPKEDKKDKLEEFKLLLKIWLKIQQRNIKS